LFSNFKHPTHSSMDFSADSISQLKSWKEVFIGVDIGASNTRISASKNITEGYIDLVRFRCNSVSELLSNINKAAQKVAELDVHVKAAALDAAGPINRENGDIQVIITNWPSDNCLKISQLPETLFPKGKSTMLNDLEAGCFGILALNAQKSLSKYFKPLWETKNPSDSLMPKTYMVLAMGTGLGVGSLFYAGDKHMVIPMEVGHSLVTSYGPEHPDYKQDTELYNFISNLLYKGVHGVEFEDICSGRGLEYSYQFLIKDTSKPKKTAEEIGKSVKEDELAARAMHLHYKTLIRCAQNIAISMNAKGIILSGDNQVYNKDFVFSSSDALKKDFLHHPKQAWIEDSPVLAQVESVNTMILGCLYKASEL